MRGARLAAGENFAMLLTMATLARIRNGEVDLVFRRWRKPTVKSGGRLRTAVGELAIGSVGVVDHLSIGDGDARRAGFESADDLRADLFRERPPSASRGRMAKPTEDSVIYRVEVSFVGGDDRAALRDAPATGNEVAAVVARLAATDARSKRGPWTGRTLGLIAQWPGRRAPELAEMEGVETLVFKADVRKLKELGLTESLRVGYRLSIRGEQIYGHLRDGGLVE
jgi:hypothetical protein